jgi:hypothetical protein
MFISEWVKSTKVLAALTALSVVAVPVIVVADASNPVYTPKKKHKAVKRVAKKQVRHAAAKPRAVAKPAPEPVYQPAPEPVYTPAPEPVYTPPPPPPVAEIPPPPIAPAAPVVAEAGGGGMGWLLGVLGAAAAVGGIILATSGSSSP